MADFQQVLDAALALSPDERSQLVDRLLGDIPEPPETMEVPDDLKREFDRRLADIEANPNDEVPWEQVKAEVLEDLRRCRTD
jgi:putative addiction module component (TIGR02574 family)